MSTLLLRLAAPLQSWGVDAKFDRRSTEKIPTKSGVIGLISAALGRRRDESTEVLYALRFGVRVDREGKLMRDYHMVHEREFWRNHEGKYTHITTRYYLSDAIFLVGLEGEENLLSEIEHALHFPVFPLFLGRRSCPPEGQLSLGIRKGKSILEALKDEPWLVSNWEKNKYSSQVQLQIVADAGGDADNVFYQRDIPISFNQNHRKYGFRRVFEHTSLYMFNPAGRDSNVQNPTEHDPMTGL